MAIDAQDKEFLDVTEKALSTAWRRYHAAPEREKPQLQPLVKLAYQEWLDIRMKLLEPVTLSTAQDILDARQLGADINTAADHQALVLALVRFVALLTKFS